MSARGWWYRASREQKLAQIDGGIECGLTAREVAICSGIDPDTTGRHGRTVHGYASNHGRRFPLKRAHIADKRLHIGNARRAYWQGARDLRDAAVAHQNGVPDELVFE